LEKKKKQTKKSGKSFFHIFSAALFACFFVDRIVKFLLLKNFFFGEAFPIIPRVLYFNLTGNSGAAFSMLSGNNTLLIFASLMAIGAVLFFSKEISKEKWLSLFSGILAGGILGNLYDRIFYGFVVDYLDFRFFPVFNIADSCLTIAAIALIAIIIKKK
jgi:signal peptidase II